MLTDELRRRLDSLVRKPHVARPSAAHAPPPREVLAGAPFTKMGQTCWRIATAFEVDAASAAVQPQGRWCVAGGKPDEAPLSFDLSRTLIVDVETGGFAGTPVFLLGVVCPDRRPLCVEQYLVRDYPEEAALLGALAELSTPRDTWVTFNGKSFDAPVLLERAALHRVRVQPPALHIDLLHLARRRWKGQVTNCRLTTLEREVLDYHRVGDVPSRDVPDLLHHFVVTGNARPLQPVLTHNVRDLVTAYELLLRLAERLTDCEVPGPDAA